MTSQTSGTAIHPLAHKEVRLDVPSSHSDSDVTAVESEKPAPRKRKISLNPRKWRWPSYLNWVPGQLNWQGLKPVIRASIASWIVCDTAIVSDSSHSCYCFVLKLKISRDKRPSFILWSGSFNHQSTLWV